MLWEARNPLVLLSYLKLPHNSLVTVLSPTSSGELSRLVSASPLGGGHDACECGQGPEEGRDTVRAG